MVGVIRSIKILSLLSFLSLLGACDKQAIELHSEHLNAKDLDERIRQSTGFKNLAGDVSIELLGSEDSPASLLVRGDRAMINQIIEIAKVIDRPQSYYLQVTNTQPGSISTSSNDMKILLHPNHQISLGHLTLQSGPWSNYVAGRKHLLELILNEKLMLKVNLTNGEDSSISYYSGVHPLQLDAWVEAFTLGGISEKRKVVTTTKKKQLWLRLSKAGSQSR